VDHHDGIGDVRKSVFGRFRSNRLNSGRERLGSAWFVGGGGVDWGRVELTKY